MEGAVRYAQSTRFAVLKGYKLYFYHSKEDLEPDEQFLLRGYSLDRSSPGRVRLLSDEDSSNIEFIPENPGDETKWLDGLQEVIRIITMTFPPRPKPVVPASTSTSSPEPPQASPVREQSNSFEQNNTSMIESNSPIDSNEKTSSNSVEASAESLSVADLEVRGSGVFPKVDTLILRDYDHAFSFECPTHWETTMEMQDDFQETHNACIVTMGPNSDSPVPSFFFVDIILPFDEASEPYPQTIDELISSCESIVRQEGGETTVVDGAITATGVLEIGPHVFKRIGYTTTDFPDEYGERVIKFCFWCIFKNERAYRIGYKADEEAFSLFLPEAEQIMETFAFMTHDDAWSKPSRDSVEAVEKFHLEGSMRYVSRNNGFSLMAPTVYDRSTWRISFVDPLLVSFHVIVPDEEDEEDRLVIANVQVLREAIEEEELREPDKYADTSRAGILALASKTIRATGHDIEKTSISNFEARRFLTILEYIDDFGQVSRSQHLLTYTVLRGRIAWILQFSTTEESAMDVFLPVVEEFVLPSFHLFSL